MKCGKAPGEDGLATDILNEVVFFSFFKISSDIYPVYTKKKDDSKFQSQDIDSI